MTRSTSQWGRTPETRNGGITSATCITSATLRLVAGTTYTGTMSTPENARRYRPLAMLGAVLLAVSGVACEKGTAPAGATGRTKTQEPRSVRVVAAAVERFPRTVTATTPPGTS